MYISMMPPLPLTAAYLESKIPSMGLVVNYKLVFNFNFNFNFNFRHTVTDNLRVKSV